MRKTRNRGALLLIFLLALSSFAFGEGGLAVSLPEAVRGYTPCEIQISAPAAGEAELRLYDAGNNCWLTRRETLSAGENSLAWDGLGENRERLFAGPYRFEIALRAAEGKEYTAMAEFEISGTTPTLVYALPSSYTLYLDGSERWFTEFYTSYVPCLVNTEIRDASGQTVWSQDTEITLEDGGALHWTGALGGGKRIAPGAYTVSCRSKLNPDWEHTFPLTVAEENPLSREVKETGPVMPERGMSDEEIWALMMKPSVVINEKGSRKRIDLYPGPKVSNRPAGTLCCATQGLEVLGFEGAWAHVTAWSHTNGQKTEGYIQTKRLTVLAPNTPYGVLVDKRDQTLTVFENGKRIGTVPVSTGKPVGNETYRETPAGAFLTDVRFGASFAQEGFRYEYPIRYDGGNIIHGVGFTRSGRVKDYSANLALLGQKASHGCVRVSSFLTGESPVNIYWLWTHLPYHTRVIILDD